MAAGRGNGSGKEATVARVKAGTWVGSAVGLALAPAGAGAAPYGAAVNTAVGTAPVAQTPLRSSRAHMALNSAIEYQRRGDYEQAAAFFAQAQAGQIELTAKERDDLASGLQLNNIALQQRYTGTEQLQKAELSIDEGRFPTADELLKRVTANPYL